MHRLFDPTPGSEHTATQYNHTDSTGSYRIQLVTEDCGEHLEVERWNAETECYDKVELKQDQHDRWLELTKHIRATEGNHLPQVGHPLHPQVQKVLMQEQPSVASMQERIKELEAEVAKLKTQK